jgi:hypothetical protein
MAEGLVAALAEKVHVHIYVWPKTWKQVVF